MAETAIGPNTVIGLKTNQAENGRNGNGTEKGDGAQNDIYSSLEIWA